MKEIDVRGLSCPEPVIHVKSELDKNTGEFKVLASEAGTVKNITKAVESYNRSVEVEEDGQDFLLTVK